ncbi:hypothetical protein D6D11_03579 [Aureobasidium pullulans]|nr:hypothetical protein D6D11_03579 [Aureobasidium pullulans]
MGCLSAIFVRSDDSRDCHNIHGRKCSHAYTTKIYTPKCDRRTYAMYDRIVVVGLYPQDTTSRDEWTSATFMNSFNFDTYKWGGMDSSPLSHSAPLTANTWNG